ncbi:MAG: TonB-dependent receptor [Vicinamibacterales bacterium]
MARISRVLSAAMIMSAGAALMPGSATAQTSGQQVDRARPSPVTQVARLSSGTITGSVADERGRPVPGAKVTAIGATMALAQTDASGRFLTEVLPAGEYVVKAHLAGFSASKREIVRVGGASASVPPLQVRRLDAPGKADPSVPSRPIVAAGFSLPQAETADESATDGSKDAHPHSETAWRLRHIKRSILKDRSNAIVVATDETLSDGSVFGRAMGGAVNFASYATSLFTDLPLTGEVNLLTSSFAPGDLFGGDDLPRGIAYVSLGSPTPAGEWQVRAAMSEGDLASWILAGSFTSKAGPSHAYTLGLSYSTQGYQGGNPVALAAMRDGSRNAGEVFGFDRWRVTPWLELDYGGRYARYDYIQDDHGLMSPRVGLTVSPRKGTRMSALVRQRMVVPGAEEFLPRAMTGPALPPERTFAAFEGHDMRVERFRGLDFLVEHQVGDAYVLGFRRFYQNVDDQLVTMFRVVPEGSPESVGHYYVGNAGAFDASGWAISMSTPPGLRVRGSIDYTVARATWTSRNEALALSVPSVLRPETEDIHDLTTSLHTDIPETATRVFVLYRFNTAFTRSDDLTRPGADARFDVQVNQALPFGVAGTKWEVLVGLRNLFRDANDPASVYDELLVVRPPKRVIGGFLVRF